MAKVSMSAKLGVGAQKVWDLVGNFNGMADWHPAFEKSELEDGGKRRRLTLADGGQIYEQLELRDDEMRTYAYSLLESPLDLVDYRARLTVVDEGDQGCTVVWACEFKSQGSEAAMVETVQDIYEGGLENLQTVLES